MKQGKKFFNILTRCKVIIIVPFTILFLSACMFKGVQNSSYLSDRRFAPKAQTAPIEIMIKMPLKPYILIGEVSAWADVPFWGTPDSQNAINKIKTMAREMGGDAIVNYRGHRAPAGTVGAGGFSAQGQVVRWRKQN